MIAVISIPTYHYVMDLLLAHIISVADDVSYFFDADEPETFIEDEFIKMIQAAKDFGVDDFWKYIQDNCTDFKHRRLKLIYDNREKSRDTILHLLNKKDEE